MSEKVPEHASKPGKRPSGVVLVLCALVVGVAAVVVWPGEKEPEYQRKKLSEWINWYQSKRGVKFRGRGLDRLGKEAEEAVRHIGTDALPFFLKWIQGTTPAWKERLATRVGRPFSVKQQVVLGQWLMREDHKAEKAIKGFEIMGEQASVAIPQLLRIMNESHQKEVSWNAIHALIGIGDGGAIFVLSAITNQTASLTVRSDAAEAVLYMDGLYRERVKVLYSCIDNPTTPAELREKAVLALAFFRMETPRFPPIDGLRQMLDDSSPSVRNAATNALRKIAPKALGTNGMREGHK